VVFVFVYELMMDGIGILAWKGLGHFGIHVGVYVVE